MRWLPALALVGCGPAMSVMDLVHESDPTEMSPPAAVSTSEPDPAPSPNEESAPDPVLAPVVSDVTTAIDTSSERRPISRLIYGHNWNDTTGTFDRLGGDRMCSYNWELNVESSGGQEDAWFYWNDSNYYGENEPAGDYIKAIDTNLARGATTMVILPLLDYVAGDASGQVDVTANPDYIDHFKRNVIDGAGEVSQSEFVQFLKDRYPSGGYMIGLDNEPELWPEAFPVLSSSPTGAAIPMTGAHTGWEPPAGDDEIGHRVTADEFTSRVITAAKMIRRISPDIEIMGPSHFGWDGMTIFNDLDSGYDDDHWYMDAFLDALAAAGGHLIDAYNFHWYPSPEVDGTRILDIDIPQSDAQFDAIVQNPRSYWDPTYDEDSWISRDHTNGPIDLLDRMRTHLDAHLPGTKLAITEYYPGAGAHIAGAIAEADTLGIFGKKGVYAAALWPYRDDVGMRFILGAMKMYERFGDTSVKAVYSDTTKGSAYASVSGDDVIVVLINKENVARINAVSITHAAPLAKAEVYSLTTATPERKADLTVTNNALVYTMPARSVTTLVLTP